MARKKNPAAQAMAKKRWAGTTKAERKAYGRKIVTVRWDKVRQAAVEATAAAMIAADDKTK